MDERIAVRRVYANGTEKHETVTGVRELIDWLEYNSLMRPGCSLFVGVTRVVTGLGGA